MRWKSFAHSNRMTVSFETPAEKRSKSPLCSRICLPPPGTVRPFTVNAGAVHGHDDRRSGVGRRGRRQRGLDEAEEKHQEPDEQHEHTSTVTA